MFDTSKALKTGRSFAEKALAFARDTTVLKDFEADVKRVLTPDVKAETSAAPQAEPKLRPTVGQGVSQVEIYDSMPKELAPSSQVISIEVSRFGVRLDLPGKGAVAVHIVDGELCFAKMNTDGAIDDAHMDSAMSSLDAPGDVATDMSEPTKPRFKMSQAKHAILQRLKDAGKPRNLTGMHALSIRLCHDHGWIKTYSRTGKAPDKIWSITPAGENALAWIKR